MKSEYLSQTEIGTIYSVSSHVVGRWLKQLGLRTAEGHPTTTALELGYAAERSSRNPGTYFWVWHRERTVALLEKWMPRLLHVQIIGNHRPGNPEC